MIDKLKSGLGRAVYAACGSYVILRGAEGAVYLTFDDGPHDVRTRKALDILADHDVRATFFFNGDLMAEHPDVVGRAVADGHQVGYHSFEHETPSSWNVASCLNDLRRGRRLLRRHGVRDLLYRPPYGALTPAMLCAAVASGWQVIMWSHEGRDSFDDRDQILENLDGIRSNDGSIVLLHDVYQRTLDILPEFLVRQKDGGIRFERLGSAAG